MGQSPEGAEQSSPEESEEVDVDAFLLSFCAGCRVQSSGGGTARRAEHGKAFLAGRGRQLFVSPVCTAVQKSLRVGCTVLPGSNG